MMMAVLMLFCIVPGLLDEWRPRLRRVGGFHVRELIHLAPLIPKSYAKRRKVVIRKLQKVTRLRYM
jgi:hypothetical protein